MNNKTKFIQIGEIYPAEKARIVCNNLAHFRQDYRIDRKYSLSSLYLSLYP